MNHFRLIAAIIIAIALGAGDVFAQQANIHNVSSQQVDPTVLDLPITGSTVSDIHLRPLFTTTIRLPEPVTSVAVGAPTLFKVEHSTDDPRLVFIKPTSADAAVSNLIIALKSGQEISIRLLSNGQASTAPVDFVVNYEPRQSFLIGSTDALAGNAAASSDPPAQAKPIDVALREEENLASPQWVNGLEKQARNGGGAASTEPILVALGTVQDRGDKNARGVLRRKHERSLDRSAASAGAVAKPRSRCGQEEKAEEADLGRSSAYCRVPAECTAASSGAAGGWRCRILPPRLQAECRPARIGNRNSKRSGSSAVTAIAVRCSRRVRSRGLQQG